MRNIGKFRLYVNYFLSTRCCVGALGYEAAVLEKGAGLLGIVGVSIVMIVIDVNLRVIIHDVFNGWRAVRLGRGFPYQVGDRLQANTGG